MISLFVLFPSELWNLVLLLKNRRTHYQFPGPTLEEREQTQTHMHTHTQRTYSRACTTLPVDTLHTTQTIAVFKKKYSINFRKSKLILRLDVLRYVYPYCTFMHLRQVTKKTCKNCIICKVKTKMRLTWETLSFVKFKDQHPLPELLTVSFHQARKKHIFQRQHIVCWYW